MLLLSMGVAWELGYYLNISREAQQLLTGIILPGRKGIRNIQH